MQTSASGPLRPRPRWRGFATAVFLLTAGAIFGVLLYQSAGAWAQGSPIGRAASFVMHDGHGFGGGFWMPSRMEWEIDRALWSVDATADQRKKITAIAERAADDIYALREQHLAGRQQIRQALAAATVDHAEIEALRGEQMKLADSAPRWRGGWSGANAGPARHRCRRSSCPSVSRCITNFGNEALVTC